MVAWAIKNMGGMIPRVSARQLPDNMAEQAVNCDLSSGALDTIPVPKLKIDLATPARRAYRFPNANNTDEVWLPLPSEFSSVVRSPLANDQHRRIYWTNPGNQAPWWNTYERMDAGDPHYNLGIVQPTGAPGVIASGGSATPLVSRAYVYTYFNAYGEESAPSLPSDVTTGNPDGSWVVSGWPTSAPANPVGFNYPPVVGVRIYRTVTGLQTGAQFFHVIEWEFPSVPVNVDDGTLDSEVVNNLLLASAGWGNPVSGLDGLTAMPGGMLIGFSRNSVYFCEPNRPHAWPPAYDQSVHYDVSWLGVWDQSLVVLTAGFPSIGSGTSPNNFAFRQVRVNEPIVSRGSALVDATGVYYASQNGLVVFNNGGIKNQTIAQVTSKQWINEYNAKTIVACRHDAQYLAIDGNFANGFIFDYSEARLGVVRLTPFNAVVCVWSDEHSGETYAITSDGKVYLWDSPDVALAPLVFRWRSKQFYAPAPVSLGACQISLDPSVANDLPETLPVLYNNDPTMNLPEGVNAVFKLYAGPDGAHLVTTRSLTKGREIFRLPGGFKAFDWQCEVVSRVKIHSIELATSMKELSGA